MSIDSSVMTDKIENVLRDTTTTMGCYHFVPKMYDVFPMKCFLLQNASVIGSSTRLQLHL